MAEVAGLVLGGLPIAIELAKHYKTIHKVYSRYQNCGSEVEEFQSRLKVEQTSFCNEIQILLASLTNFETANKILAVEEHPLSNDADLKNKFSRHLGDSGSACMSIMLKIKTRLSAMENYLGNSAPNESTRDFFTRTKRKLKFSFSQSHLDTNLTELARLNADFLRISSQINRLKHLQNNTVPPSSSSKSDSRVAKFVAVRKAAVQLFEALGNACSVHPEHWAHIQLEPARIFPNEGDPPLVRFIMALTQDLIESGGTNVEPVWVVIESIVEESSSDCLRRGDEVQDALSELKNTLKRVNEEVVASPTPRKKAKSGNKAVRFISPDPEAENRKLPKQEQRLVIENHLPDFSKNHNFCMQVQKQLMRSRLGPDKCIGYLRKNEKCKHRVLSNPSIPSCQTRQSISLGRLIALMSQKSYEVQLLQYESLRLARQLASAVLQFHTTPLLKSSWRSDDVVFFGMDEPLAAKHLTLMAPYLNVHVKEKAPEQNTLVSTHVGIPRGGVAGNPYLFGLGVILIELEYQAPFQSLRRDVDLVDGKADSHTDFRTAIRVSESIGSRLGASYGRIVRKCLYCDFGADSRKLTDAPLQAAFHRDVICELEQLEAKIKRFQIGD